MTREFNVKVKFNTTQEVVNCITNNLDIDKLNNDGTMIINYSGNIKSGTNINESVERGVKHFLNNFSALKRNYSIIEISEE